MNTEPKPKRSLGCCLLKIVALCFVLALFGAGLVGYGIYSTASWFKNVAESAPANFQPLIVSDGERQDIDRILFELNSAKQSRELIDESITPNVFNGILDAIIQGEKNKGKAPELEAVRGNIENGHFSLAFSARKKHPEKSDDFINGRALFDLELENGSIKVAHVHSLIVAGREAPWIVRTFVNNFILPKLRNPNDPESIRNTKGFKPIRLLKLEGERLHVILDPKLFKQEINDAPAPPPPSLEKNKDKTEF